MFCSVESLFLHAPHSSISAAPIVFPSRCLQLVTSLTTAISFFVNASSHFPAVESFGIFSAVLVSSHPILPPV